MMNIGIRQKIIAAVSILVLLVVTLAVTASVLVRSLTETITLNGSANELIVSIEKA